MRVVEQAVNITYAHLVDVPGKSVNDSVLLAYGNIASPVSRLRPVRLLMPQSFNLLRRTYVDQEY